MRSCGSRVRAVHPTTARLRQRVTLLSLAWLRLGRNLERAIVDLRCTGGHVRRDARPALHRRHLHFPAHHRRRGRVCPRRTANGGTGVSAVCLPRDRVCTRSSDQVRDNCLVLGNGGGCEMLEAGRRASGSPTTRRGEVVRGLPGSRCCGWPGIRSWNEPRAGDWPSPGMSGAVSLKLAAARLRHVPRARKHAPDRGRSRPVPNGSRSA